jgi:hypothetical protein
MATSENRLQRSPDVIAIPPDSLDNIVRWDGTTESGGFLLGFQTETAVLVDHVVDAGPFAASMLDWDWAHRMAEVYGRPLMGDWKLGSDTPCEQEKGCWARSRYLLELPIYASVIVPVEDIWRPMGFTTYMRDGQPFTKKVDVVREHRG